MPAIGMLLVAAAASGGSAALILTGYPRFAGLTTILSAAALMGGLAAARMKRDRRATFAAHILDRIHDASVLAPVAWVARQADVGAAILALVGLGAAFVAAYERARGASLGFRVREPPAYRGLLSLILAVGLLGRWTEGALWAFAAIALAAATIRARTVGSQYRRSEARRT